MLESGYVVESVKHHENRPMADNAGRLKELTKNFLGRQLYVIHTTPNAPGRNSTASSPTISGTRSDWRNQASCSRPVP